MVTVGQKARGVFDLCGSDIFGRRKRTLYEGEVIKVEGERFTVQYKSFRYTYNVKNIGKIIFLNQQQEELESQNNREVRM